MLNSKISMVLQLLILLEQLKSWLVHFIFHFPLTNQQKYKTPFHVGVYVCVLIIISTEKLPPKVSFL
jgi:hypothetical protein